MASAAELAAELAKLPGLPPPSVDIVPNFVDPYNRAYLITLTTGITLTITTLFILIRTYTKFAINKFGLGWDDYVSILAYIGFAAYASIGLQCIHYGGFTHQWNVPAIKVMHFLQIVNWLEILYSPVMLLTKISILVQLLHIFAPARHGATYWICLLLMGFNVLFYTSTMIVGIFQCTPREKFWNPLLPGHCVNINTVNIVTASINAVSDLVLLLLPITCVWQLQMSQKQKLGVSAVFATALFACVSSVMRIVTSVQFVGDKDITWGILSEGLWALGEISSGIICGCMPTLPQFCRHFIPIIKTKLSSRDSSQSSSDAYSKQSGPNKESAYGSARKPSNNYHELDEQSHKLKTDEISGAGLRIWTDEVSAVSVTSGDEEGGLPRGTMNQASA